MNGNNILIAQNKILSSKTVMIIKHLPKGKNQIFMNKNKYDFKDKTKCNKQMIIAIKSTLNK